MPEGRNKISGGFTILELLISVSIIAVLAAMILALSDTIRTVSYTHLTLPTNREV